MQGEFLLPKIRQIAKRPEQITCIFVGKCPIVMIIFF